MATRANVPPRGAKKYGQAEMVPIDTTNILFICGGSFTGIEQLIQRRIGRQGLGFGAEIKRADERRLGEILRDLEPQDLQKFGLIPEFVGRLPVLATLDDLEDKDLERILTIDKERWQQEIGFREEHLSQFERMPEEIWEAHRRVAADLDEED